MKKILLIELICFTISCDFEDDSVDPCHEYFDWKFMDKIKQNFEVSSSYSMSSNHFNKLVALNCDTLNLMIGFSDSVEIESESTVNKIVDLFFTDTNHMEVSYINLKLKRSNSPELKTFLKKTIIDYSFKRNQLVKFESNFNEIPLNVSKTNEVYGVSYSDKKRNYLGVEFEANIDNPKEIDKKIVEFKDSYSNIIHQKSIEELSISVSVIQPNYHLIKSKEYKYFFCSQNGNL